MVGGKGTWKDTPDYTKRVAIIFGVTGQDGSYLSELLLSKGYRVIGIRRRSSVDTTERLDAVCGHPKFELVEGDVGDAISVANLLQQYQPHECYNLAAQSHVGTSFKQPSYTFQVDAVGVLNILEAIRTCSVHTRFYQASTSEMFGNNYHTIGLGNQTIIYQDETVPLAPTSPYAVAKVAAHYLVSTYRTAYNIHASCGILFNHESERRGENFVTRKITKWIGALKLFLDYYDVDWDNQELGSDDIVSRDGTTFAKLRLGTLDAVRDWGHAKDYVRGMWMMMQEESPDDYVIATGRGYTVQQFIDAAFNYVGLPAEECIVIDPKFCRPSEVYHLCGNAKKATDAFGWKPKITFDKLVHGMVDSDIQKAKGGVSPPMEPVA